MIHVAGVLDGEGVQRCTRCDEVITDYRGAMVPEGSPPLSGWAEGAHVEVMAGFPRVAFVSDGEPNCERRH